MRDSRRDLGKDGSEGIFTRENSGLLEDNPQGDDALRCGYENITLPTGMPSVAAGDVMKDPRKFMPRSELDHEYEMPDFRTRQFMGGMSPRLIQHNGEDVDYRGDDEFDGNDEEWDPKKADQDISEGQTARRPKYPKR